MASTAPRLPEQFRTSKVGVIEDFHVNEIASDQAGSLSPFGPELQFPLPIDQIIYTHPTAADRPHLADGR
ncbi:hypothetical protein [Jatrophihabitans sp.]|uniref:hypothetical protein n=1 Tax=Jatrophihabitans sp. TaxID=1932789 RepID=UPI0030C65A81|nr:hypothetical protein [Jatrophihabitans sp.]